MSAPCCVRAPGVVVEWVNEHQEQLLPYDVRVTAPGGKVTYVEVKTVGQSGGAVCGACHRCIVPLRWGQPVDYPLLAAATLQATGPCL
jgi:hypothetical protein